MKEAKTFLFGLLAISFVAVAAAAGLEEGALVKNSQGTIFLMRDGKLHGIPSVEVFASHGFDGADVIDLSDEEIAAIPAGEPLGMVAAPVPYPSPKDGDLVQSVGNAVCLIQDGVRRPIPNPNVFNANGLEWEKIIAISEADFNAIPEGMPLEAPIRPYPEAKDGDIVRGSFGPVYLIRNGKRCGIPNPDTFHAHGLKWEDIIVISDEDLEDIPVGRDLRMP
jgi:hypothetical protein